MLLRRITTRTKERDFGAFEHNGERIFWKIDYYDTTLTKGSEDPSDPKQTVRGIPVGLPDALNCVCHRFADNRSGELVSTDAVSHWFDQ